MYKIFFKRLLDIILSSGALLFLSPVLMVVAYKIKKNLGSPVIYTAERPGKYGKIFRLYKFRSMTDECDQKGNLLPDSERLTPFGRKLRSSSIDELPELLNILKGDMSIVGPRPLAKIYLDYYNDFEKHRHDVRPGLTGLAQINGRNAISWTKKFEYDVFYVNNLSFILDCEIIFKTFMKVINKEDIGQGEEAPESFHIVRQREWDRMADKND